MGDILLIESFYDGSHRSLIDLVHRSFSPRTALFTLPGDKWPWRARCSALLMSQVIPRDVAAWQYLFTSSVLNLVELLALRVDLRRLKTIVYFHENDFVYPKRNAHNEQRDFQYGYNQILTALTADRCLFNSEYNRQTFVEQLAPFLHRMPSPKPDVQQIRQAIESKCHVAHYPLERRVDPARPVSRVRWAATTSSTCDDVSRSNSNERARCASSGRIDGNTTRTLRRSSRSSSNCIAFTRCNSR
jgi:hypothetical protein